MTHDEQSERPLDRRLLLRGGAMLVGAAGATVVGAALGSTTASAADGAPVVIGRSNTGTVPTVLTTTAGAAPALSLVNKNGAALRMTALPGEFVGLGVGDLAGSDFGPLVGVDYGQGAGVETTYLLTPNDLPFIPVATPQETPKRLLDTRNSTGRLGILNRSSSTALDSQGRLTGNSWIDVKVDPSNADFELTGVFLNVAVVEPVANGYLTVYRPVTRPNTSTINFRSGVSLSNAAFVGPGTSANFYVVRIHTSQTAHVLLDYAGSVVNSAAAPASVSSVATTRRQRQSKRTTAIRTALQRPAG
jgi:hypothetical protein